MAGRHAEQIMAAHRSTHAPDEEPIVTDTRKVREFTGSAEYEDLGVNLASLFRDLNEIAEGDEVTVEVYRERYVIIPKTEDDE